MLGCILGLSSAMSLEGEEEEEELEALGDLCPVARCTLRCQTSGVEGPVVEALGTTK